MGGDRGGDSEQRPVRDETSPGQPSEGLTERLAAKGVEDEWTLDENRFLPIDVSAGRFRSDLFYRLAVVKVRMPALRNIRELRNHLERNLVFDTDPCALEAAETPALDAVQPEPRKVPFAEAQRIARDAFERGYVETLMRLVRRQGLRPVS